MKCPVCKKPVPEQAQEGYYGGVVDAPHPGKNGKICDGSGRPSKR